MDPKDLFGSAAKDPRENVSLFGSLNQQFGTPPPISPMNKEKQVGLEWERPPLVVHLDSVQKSDIVVFL